MRQGGESVDVLRVAVVGPYPAEEGRARGGVEAVTSALADGLASVDGVEAHAVTLVQEIGRPQQRVNALGVRVHLVPEFRTLGCMTGFSVDGPRIRAALREIDPHIVHVHGVLAYSHCALERGWPSILTIHGIYYRETASQRGKDWLQTRLACGYEINSVRRARHISALNRYSTSAYEGRIRTRDIRYIDNPINDQFFSVPGSAEPGRILFGGFISDLKNLLYLLEAIVPLKERHPELRLRVAGGVREPEYHERCLAFVSEHGLEGNVELLGALSMDQMIEEQSKASMLVLCSKQENAPMIISEAMAAGNPVIATPVGGVPEMIEHEKTGFVVSLEDAGELSSRIGCLLDDPALARRMGEAGRSVAERRFKRSAVVEKTVQFYKDVIESERRPK